MASDCEVRTLSSIGSEIKSWCKQNKVNQTELAAALDVSTMTVRRVWKGTKELTSVQIAIMLEVMPHVTADFFIPTDMGERCIEYAQNLNKGYRTEMQLDWWIASQWEEMPTKTKFKTRSNAQGTEIKSHAYRALRRSRLKEMHAVRYADDFKIFCATHEDAVRAYKATELWLKDRLGLEISPDKSKVVNLKRQYSDFLGFKLKVRKKGKKYVVRSHMSDKAYKKAHEKVSEEVKKLAHSSDDNAQFMQLQKYNSVVAGLHEYYCISTEVSHDFSRLAFSINKQLRNRLKGDLSKKGQLRNGFIKEKYGASRQMRFLHGRPVVPLGYVQSKNAQHKRKSINKYTVKGREQIHKNLAIDTATMLWLMRNPVKGRTIEYADNRISLYAAQYGKCAVTGIPMDSHDIHCHHKVPVSNGGSDEYANLILVSKAVHILIHASSEPTIEKYLKSLNLDNKQIEKLNKLRTMAEMPPIIL